MNARETRVACGCLALLLSIPAALRAHPLDHWSARFTNSPASSSFFSIAYGNGCFVATGAQGLAARSPDGRNWTTNYPTTNALYSVTFAGGQFLAGGERGTFLTSPDGTSWTAHYLDANWTLASIRYGNSRFVATGYLGSPTIPHWVVFRSLDGTTWTAQELNIVAPSDRFDFGNGLFVQNFFGSANLLSGDGTNWWWHSAGTTNALYTVAFAGGTFVEVDTRNRVYTSADATNWTFRGTNRVLRPTEIAYGNGVWVALGGATPPDYSADLGSWRTSAQTVTGYHVAFGDGTFVLASQKIMQSDPLIQLRSAAAGTFSLSGPTNIAYQIEAAGELGSPWLVITNLVPDTSPYFWSDPEVADHASRFYRALLP